MDNEKSVISLYNVMYEAMINKDRVSLEKTMDDEFVLVHMTGMRQSKGEYIDSVLNGTMNYYDKKDVEIKAEVNGNSAHMTGKSIVTAAVFGGGRNSWRLKLEMKAVKREEGWKFTYSTASIF